MIICVIEILIYLCTMGKIRDNNTPEFIIGFEFIIIIVMLMPPAMAIFFEYVTACSLVRLRMKRVFATDP